MSPTSRAVARSTLGAQITAIVPLKALDQAKGRLAGDLDPSSRRALVAWMFGRVMAACRDAALIGPVLVVAGDRAAADIATAHDVRILVEERPGLQRALAVADAATAAASATLVLAADLPLARGPDLDRMCAAGGGLGGGPGRSAPPAVVVAPTRDGGTGALYRCPPTVIETRYGPGSAAAHLALARAAGVNAVVTRVPALALDVDTAGQLRAAAQMDREVAAWTTALRDRRPCRVCPPPAV